MRVFLKFKNQRHSDICHTNDLVITRLFQSGHKRVGEEKEHNWLNVWVLESDVWVQILVMLLTSC